jgi:hypothetical protein
MEERMANLAVLESPLQRELEAMSPEQCEARVGELGSLNTMMLQRENNMACNRAGAKGVVDSVAAELTAEQAQPKKSVQKKRRAPTTTKKKAKCARRAESEEEETASESDTDASDSEGHAEPPKTRGRNRGGAARAGAPSDAERVAVRQALARRVRGWGRVQVRVRLHRTMEMH